MQKRGAKVREAVWCLLVFAGALLLAYLWMQTAVPSVRPEHVEHPQGAADEQEREIGMAEAVWGLEDVLSSGLVYWVDPVGMEMVFPEDNPVRTVYFLTPDTVPYWPEQLTIQSHTTQERMAFRCIYDTETKVPASIGAYLSMEAPPDQVNAALYDGNLNLLKASALEWRGSSEGWVDMDLTGAPALVEDTTYYLCFWTHNPEEPPVGAGTAMHRAALPPVSLGSSLEVADVLRVGVALSSAIVVSDSLRTGVARVALASRIAVTESLRTGVALASRIAVTESLKARLKPSGGFCLGHHIPEEDVP